MTIYIITGLPGSGKTHLGRELAAEKGIALIDDIDDFGKLRLEKEIEQGHDVIITDPWLCVALYRNRCVDYLRELQPDVTLEWLMFENDPHKAIANIKRRNDGRTVTELLRTLTTRYSIPQGIVPIPIYTGEP